MSSFMDIAQLAANVAIDPCLRQVIDQVDLLVPASSEDTGPTQASLGVGLCHAVKPLKVAVFFRQNPWIGAATLAGFLGIFVGIGYRLGQWSKSK